jgi:hypothetical protein
MSCGATRREIIRWRSPSRVRARMWASTFARARETNFLPSVSFVP